MKNFLCLLRYGLGWLCSLIKYKQCIWYKWTIHLKETPNQYHTNGEKSKDKRKVAVLEFYKYLLFLVCASYIVIPLLHRSPIRFNAHWIQLRSVVASPNTVTMRIDAHYFQSTHVCGLRNSVRFDSILFDYVATGHCIIQFNSVRLCTTWCIMWSLPAPFVTN